ncbi:MAG: hypothetical protein NT077_02370 [Candidatus Taylorbacteria bacterium]|nr:hypothetical protein [Candidatus Taylorbacteria bacterium]
MTCVLNARRERQMQYGLNRHHANPIIKPLAHNHWESEGTFNPGAVVDDTGTIHLFYRAIGKDGISRVGHTTSSDGKLFMNRSAFPVYEPERGYGMPEKSPMNAPHKYDLSAHASGGGWGGAEDPRVVKIDDRIYMTYTAFEGWASMRIGLTSINEKDMEKGQWKWKKPVIISPPGSRAKNWVLFPEKINGKYAILHAIAPKIRVAYVDSPEMAPEIKTVGDHGGGGYEDKGRKESWDHFVRGAGAPPLKTRLGWLLLYHAFDKRNPKKIVGYKVGAMILDLNDPTKVLYRSPQPILSPDMPYENDGKPGVVYASGAIIRDDKLLVYYGGGDKTTCVAETPLDPLLTWLTTYGKI